MANLAIRGHATRGKEVIEILEMLGGKNKFSYYGESESYVFYIIDEIIDCDEARYLDDYIIYTLEGFLEKFPYKVGDKVSSKYLKNYEVSKMEWESANNRVIYKLQGMGWYSANELQPYKEETMEDIIKIYIPKGYEFAGVDDDNQQVVFEKIGCRYPKTYEECCRILDNHPNTDYVEGYKWKLMMSFQKLLVCRDAYWKLYGEQMGLGKPWKPDWRNEEDKCTIVVHDNQHCYANCKGACSVLTFPTVEMRDAFFENFRHLIEQCRELL